MDIASLNRKMVFVVFKEKIPFIGAVAGTPGSPYGVKFGPVGDPQREGVALETSSLGGYLVLIEGQPVLRYPNPLDTRQVMEMYLPIDQIKAVWSLHEEEETYDQPPIKHPSTHRHSMPEPSTPSDNDAHPNPATANGDILKECAAQAVPSGLCAISIPSPSDS